MAIPESIKKKANQVRNEVYGKDVREALASGIEEAGDIADQANTKSEYASDKVDNIQSQVDQLVVEGDSSVEAAQARVNADGSVTYTTLKERLDTEYTEVTAQLAERANQSIDVHNIDEEFGGDLSLAIDSIADGSVLVFNKGIYDLTGWITKTINKNIIFEGAGKEQTVIKGDGLTNLFKGNGNIVIKNLTFENWQEVLDYTGCDKLVDIEIYNISTANCKRLLYWGDPTSISTSSGIKKLRVRECELINNGYGGIVLFPPVIRSAHIVDVEIDGGANRGIQLGDDNETFQNTRDNFKIRGTIVRNISNTTSSSVNGILVYGWKAVITGCTIENLNNNLTTDCEGIYTKCKHSIIEGNILIDAGHSEAFIDIKGTKRDDVTGVKGYDVSCKRNKLINTKTDKTVHGIKIQNEDVVVSDNEFEGFTGIPIYMGSSTYSNVIISNNKIRKTLGSTGISIAGDGVFIKCFNNLINEVLGTYDNGQPFGIRVFSTGGGDIEIKNNTIHDVIGNISNGYCIAVKPTGVVNGLNIEGNNLNNASNGILFATTAPDDVWIHLNHFRNISGNKINYGVTPTNLLEENNKGIA